MSNKELLENLREALIRYKTGHEDCRQSGICLVLRRISGERVWYDNKFQLLLNSCFTGSPFRDDIVLFPLGDIPPRIDLLKKVIKKVECEGIEL